VQTSKDCIEIPLGPISSSKRRFGTIVFAGCWFQAAKLPGPLFEVMRKPTSSKSEPGRNKKHCYPQESVDPCRAEFTIRKAKCSVPHRRTRFVEGMSILQEHIQNIFNVCQMFPKNETCKEEPHQGSGFMTSASPRRVSMVRSRLHLGVNMLLQNLANTFQDASSIVLSTTPI
jgi:hypothetical protein